MAERHMQYVKHNKLKNTGILFESLVRQITADTLALREHSPAVDILRKYMNAKTELGRELSLYRAFFNNTKPLSEARAIDLLNLVCNQRKRLNEKQLKAEKYNLISEIKKHYDLSQFLSVRVPSYKIYASIYKQFAVISENIDSDVEQLSNARFTILEHLGGHGSSATILENSIETMWKQQDDDLRVLAYKILLEKFNTKYANLTTKQKDLLRVYINNVSNSKTLYEYVNKEIKSLTNSISSKLPHVPDTILRIKINEVLHQLKRMSTLKEVKSNHMTGLLIAYEIEKELNQVQTI